MGKETNWDDPYFTRRKETDDLAKKYGVDKDSFIEADIDGERGMTDDGYKKYEAAISNAAANDYDTRRSLEVAKLAGYEGADQFGTGLSGLEEVNNAYNFLEGIHSGELGNTGKFSSANDFGNVTNFLVNNDRSQFKDEMSKSFGDYMEDNKQPESADGVNQQAKPIEYSPELQAAHSRVSEFEKGVGGSNNVFQASLPDGNAESTGDGKQQRNQAAQSFSDDYKLKLMDGLQLG